MTSAQVAHSHLLATGPIEWLMNELSDKLFGCGTPDAANNCRDGVFGTLFGSEAADPARYDALYGAVQVAGIILAACAAAARLIRLLSDQRATGSQLILDTVVRFAVVILLIGPDARSAHAPALAGIHWLLDASRAMAEGINHAFTGAHPVLESPALGTDAFIGAARAVARLFGGKLGFVGVVSLAVSLILILYLGILYVARLILVAVCIATAPLCIALAAFDQRNRFFEWWVDSLAGAVFIPVVMFPAIGIVFSLAGSGGILQNLIFTPLILMGGLWITGRAVHRLTWRHFQHGGPIGALTAGMAGAWVAPQMAFEAFISSRALGLRGGRGIYGLPGLAGGRVIDALIEASSRKHAASLAASDIERWKTANATRRDGGEGSHGIGGGGQDGGGSKPTGFDQLSPSNRHAVLSASAPHGGQAHFERFLDETLPPGMGSAGSLNANDRVGEYLNSLPLGGGDLSESLAPYARTRVDSSAAWGQFGGADDPTGAGRKLDFGERAVRDLRADL